MPKLEILQKAYSLCHAYVPICFEADICNRLAWQNVAHHVFGNNIQTWNLYNQKNLLTLEPLVIDKFSLDWEIRKLHLGSLDVEECANYLPCKNLKDFCVSLEGTLPSIRLPPHNNSSIPQFHNHPPLAILRENNLQGFSWVFSPLP
jgi:hypothetical protein